MSDYLLFEIRVSITFKDVRRNEFGYVEEHGPNTKHYHTPEENTHYVVSKRKEQAVEKIKDLYQYSLSKNFKISDVVEHRLDSVILEI